MLTIDYKLQEHRGLLCSLLQTPGYQQIGGLTLKHFWVQAGNKNGNPLQFSCLENSMARGAWPAAVHGIAESGRTELLTLSLSGNKMCESSFICKERQA